MDAAKKKAWDTAWAATVKTRDAADVADKKAAGYDVLTIVGKTQYDTELLAWKKAVHQTCKTDAKALKCVKARAIRDPLEAHRKTSKFYGKTEAE